MRVYKTTSPYLAAFIISKQGFTLGKVFIEEKNQLANKATIEIVFDEGDAQELNELITLYINQESECNINKYQTNLRFIMNLINKRKI